MVPSSDAERTDALRHGVSIDVEDYRQILAARYRGTPGRLSSGFERDMDAVLQLLDTTGTRATFFVAGTIAKERPDLIRHWHKMGHEIASHGMLHTPIYARTPASLKEDLSEAKKATEDALGAAISGYRAPEFSIRWDTLWALDVVAECGFAYDSSIVPVRTRRYGIADFAPEPASYALSSGGEIVEIPLAVTRILGVGVPMGGGGYFRLFSQQRVRLAVAEAESQGRPFVAYSHPDELGGERFAVDNIADRVRDQIAASLVAAKANLGRKRCSSTLGALLSGFCFSTLKELADEVKSRGCTRILGKTR